MTAHRHFIREGNTYRCIRCGVVVRPRAGQQAWQVMAAHAAARSEERA